MDFFHFQLLSHTRNSPLIFIGKGNTTFTEQEGNFGIKDDVAEKIPLRYYVMTQTKDGIKMTLSDRDGTQVSGDLFTPLSFFLSFFYPSFFHSICIPPCSITCSRVMCSKTGPVTQYYHALNTILHQ